MLTIERPDPPGLGPLNTLQAEVGDTAIFVEYMRSADAQSHYPCRVRGAKVVRTTKTKVVFQYASDGEEFRLPRHANACPHVALEPEGVESAVQVIRARKALREVHKALETALAAGARHLPPQEVLEPMLAWARRLLDEEKTSAQS